MAFYHSLGRVLGVDSTDVLRILGSYPDPTPPPTPAGQPSRPPKRKAPTTLFAATPLPLALDSPHPADTFQFSALLTPAKLVIVGLKPSPRTWFRRMRAGEGGNGPDRTGTAVWRPAQAGLEPTLAFSWGHSVRFVKTVRPAREPDGFRAGGPGKDGPELDFVEDGRWEAKSTVLGMQWQSSSVSHAFSRPSRRVFSFPLLTKGLSTAPLARDVNRPRGGRRNGARARRVLVLRHEQARDQRRIQSASRLERLQGQDFSSCTSLLPPI